MNLICAFEGRLGGDATTRILASGSPMVSFSCVVETVPAKGDKPAQSEWLRCVLFGDEAATLGDRMHKGGAVYVEGRLSVDRFTGQDGVERQGLNVVASQVVPLGQIGRRAPQRTRDAVYRGGFSPQRQTPHYPVNPTPAAVPPQVRMPDDRDSPPW